MWRKVALGSFALLLVLASNLRVNCCVSVNGTQLAGRYSPEAVDRAATAVLCAAEEILPGPAVMPQIERTYGLSFTEPAGDELLLTDAALRAVTGVKLADVAYVNGTRLGIVEDGAVLFEKLDSFIKNQQPNAAVSGSISGKLEVVKRYSRTNQATNDEDMLLLITGMAPVIYVDENGKLA